MAEEPLQLKENIENSRNLVNSGKTWRTQGTLFFSLDSGKTQGVVLWSCGGIFKFLKSIH